MSNAWEMTDHDIDHVLSTHGKTEDEITFMLQNVVIDGMDYSRVEEAILRYTDMDDQINASYNELEDIFIENKIIDGPKLFWCS
jgi:hypothetical protein